MQKLAKTNIIENENKSKSRPVGLINQNNNCFVISILQCLFAIDTFSNILSTTVDFDNTSSSSLSNDISIYKETSNLLKHYNQRKLEDYDIRCPYPLDTIDFQTSLENKYSEYKDGEEYEAQEFLSRFLADLNTVDGHNQINSIFQYQTSTTIKCPDCETSYPINSAPGADDSYVFDLHVLHYLDIRSISTSKKIDFIDLLNYTQNETTCSYTCPLNNHTCDSAKVQVKFIKLPNVLIFRVLTRNINHKNKVVTLRYNLDCPLDNLELTCDSVENNNSNSQPIKQTYNLCAIVHYKQTKSDSKDIKGHYTCYIRSSLNQWYEINDICVKEVNEAIIKKISICNVDLLFYRKL